MKSQAERRIMRISYKGETLPKSVWGTLSWALGLAAILLVCFGLFAPAYSRLGAFMFYLAPVLIIAGLFSGFMGLFTTRAWIGLVLNLLLAVFAASLFIYLFGYCCAAPK